MPSAIKCHNKMLRKINGPVKSSLNKIGKKNDINTLINKYFCYSISDLTSLYKIPTIMPVEKRVKIAIVIAHTYPNLLADLETYWSESFSTSPPLVNVHTMPDATEDAGWAQECCMDLQVIATLNPNAEIWVVEAADSSSVALANAVNYANYVINADVISMSWGSQESLGCKWMDHCFTNDKTCYCVSSGDNNDVSHPASNPNCISVGGTSLFPVLNGKMEVVASEYVWDFYNDDAQSLPLGAGCGYSNMYDQPKYQSDIDNIDHEYRATPDVALLANPETGIATYCSATDGWAIMGGTSLSAPIFAAIISIVNQNRFNEGKEALTSVYDKNLGITLYPSEIPINNLQMKMYALSKKAIYKHMFNDIFDHKRIGGANNGGGNTGSNDIFRTKNGYDIPTGLGSPKLPVFISALTNRII
jgi:subtilase family serine protease